MLLPQLRALAATLALASAASAAEPVSVLATVGMIGDVAANVGGACARVATLIGEGADPHLFQPSASDVRALQQAEVVLFAGYGLEGRLGAILDRLAETRPVLAVGPAIAPPAELIPVDELDGVDPHLWMDVRLWARSAAAIAETLSTARPDCAEMFAANAAAYAADLEALHGWIGATIGTIPPGNRVLVTAHDAFGYFGRAYGLEVAAIQGLSTESEAAIADIRAVAALVVEKGVPAVFVESTINPRAVEAMVEAARALGREVRIGGELFADALGPAGSPAGTYVGMMRENARAIAEALGGAETPPPAALAERLRREGLAN